MTCIIYLNRKSVEAKIAAEKDAADEAALLIQHICFIHFCR